MGIQGLLPILRSIHRHSHLKQFTGQTLGIDGFGWLHRGACGCSLQLALGQPTTRYLDFVLSRVRMLLDFGIKPYLVFDGDAVPCKAATNAGRREERQKVKEEAMELISNGKRYAAEQILKGSATITSEMVSETLQALKQAFPDVPFLVAPYEADAQLAYLEKIGIVDAVLSEDSDLLVFGVKRLITKLDQYGDCIEIRREDFSINKDLSLATWSDTMFRHWAVLSGCDYLPRIKGLGLKTAHPYMKRHKDITKVIRAIAFNGKYILPANYIEAFEEADRSFLYHWVFCPRQQRLVHLNELPPKLAEEQLPYIGPELDPETAIGIALGELDPKSKDPVVKKLNPGRPSLQESRRQTLASTDLKPKRSLDNFFKPTRIPLAELDPNTLTPSPSQQRVYENNRNASWEPHRVTSAPQLRRSITDVPGVRHASVSARNFTIHRDNRSDLLARACAASNFKPVKRQRLCSENDEGGSHDEVKQSRFFGGVEDSPSVAKSRKSRASKKESFDIFSDDSVEGILLSLDAAEPIESEILQATTTESKVSTPADVVEKVPQSSPVILPQQPDESQSSHGTAEISRFTFNDSTQTPRLSREVSHESDPEQFVDLLEFHVSQVNQQVRDDKLFSAQAANVQTWAFENIAQAERSQDGHANTSGDHADDTSATVVLASPVRTTRKSPSSMLQTFMFRSSVEQVRAFESLSAKAAIPVASRRTLEKLEVVNAPGTEDHLVSSPPAFWEGEESDHEPAPSPERPEDQIEEPTFTSAGKTKGFNLGRFLCPT